MTFQDIFKSSFLENITSISILDMVLAMFLAFGIGMFISDKPESTSELPSEQESLPEQSVPERPANSDTSAEQSTTEPSGEIPQGTPPASQSPTENRPVGQSPEIATDNTKDAFPSGNASAVATSVTQKASAWLPLIASTVVLAAGLAIAAVYKKRG